MCISVPRIYGIITDLIVPRVPAQKWSQTLLISWPNLAGNEAMVPVMSRWNRGTLMAM